MNEFSSKLDKAFADAPHEKAIGFTISPKARNWERGAGDIYIQKLIDQHKAVLKDYFIFATEGTYKEVIKNPADIVNGKWHPRIEELEHGCILKQGKHGGLVQLASRMEKQVGNDGGVKDGCVDTLISLKLPDDMEETYPESRALWRSALRNDINLLTTFESFELWAKYEANNVSTNTVTEEDAIALISHDGMKLEMCHWVTEHRHILKEFNTIVTTGTTGKWIREFLMACGIDSSKIKTMLSGPKGGDLQIAEQILEKKINHVIFFIDPMSSHPHEADIQTLSRICAEPDLKINLRLTKRGAASWIESYKA